MDVDVVLPSARRKLGQGGTPIAPELLADLPVGARVTGCSDRLADHIIGMTRVTTGYT